MNREYYFNLGYSMGIAGAAAPSEPSKGWQDAATLAGWKAGHARMDDRPVHTVWVLNKWRPPRATKARLKITEKNVWAELFNGDRKLFNSTFFFTELAARRRWLGDLDRASHNSWTCTKTAATEVLLKYRPPKVYHGHRYFDPEEAIARYSSQAGRRP